MREKKEYTDCPQCGGKNTLEIQLENHPEGTGIF